MIPTRRVCILAAIRYNWPLILLTFAALVFGAWSFLTGLDKYIESERQKMESNRVAYRQIMEGR